MSSLFIAEKYLKAPRNLTQIYLRWKHYHQLEACLRIIVNFFKLQFSGGMTGHL